VNVSQGSAALNREQKLALIVGFSLVLLVGILLTDHLSQARSVRMDGIAEREGSLPALARHVPRSAYATQPEGRLTEVGLTSEPDAAVGTRAEQGQRVALDADPLAIGPPIVDPTSGGLAGPGPMPVRDERLAEIKSALQMAANVQGEAADRVQPQPTIRPTIQNTTPAIVDPLDADIPDPAWYTVQPNESLYVICKRFYGKGTVWRKLAAHNVGRVGEDGSIRVGVRLQIPHASVVLGPGATFAQSPEQTKPAVKQPAAKPPAAIDVASIKTRDYTIKPNDCLSKIAQAQLGTIKRQGEILALNKDRLQDADDIRSGMVIQLPAS
jgi:nucleoid-associated protein YgaU